jgi:predicted nucleic acid-binding protein
VRRTAGHPISQFDCQIAAIARAHGASVATRKTGDFEGCGVQLMDPWSHVDVHGLAPRRSMRRLV